MTKVYKPGKGLKKALAGESGRFVPHLEKWMASRKPNFRDYSYLHPSSIIKDDWCQREAWFQLSGHKAMAEPLTFSKANMFNEGHLIHAKWQKYFTEMGVLYGTWRDGDGDRTGWALAEPTYVNSGYEYLEVPLEVPDLMIRGRADGWIKGLGKDALIEIKSVGIGSVRWEASHLLNAHGTDIDKIWAGIKAPFPSHIRQGQLYLHLAHLMVERDLLESAPSEIVYIYEWKPSQLVKEFVVEYFPAASQRFIQRAKNVVDALGGEPLECSHGDSCSACAPYKLETLP